MQHLLRAFSDFYSNPFSGVFLDSAPEKKKHFQQSKQNKKKYLHESYGLDECVIVSVSLAGWFSHMDWNPQMVMDIRQFGV